MPRYPSNSGQWVAEESFRPDGVGGTRFPCVYHPPQVITVHHTKTANNDPDPAATVRAIYRYHALDRGFFDIGYHFLIDEAGRVYEGRWSGPGGPVGHDALGRVVTAAHVVGYNSANLGIALMANFERRRA